CARDDYGNGFDYW
nr:immunoglobulin heavy chain junction region [Macaca mulatta]MOW89103.1 immunoglobulin heavy chain junction region [Macaca mulatta]MOW90605.1 immunoglobulin heavy chain junction region [Macaca mulatta]MOW92587.1 immunoglobulin heavy chain junction region [Macaca mulatta]MOW93239.1 immunoglobulin heavy chain junction region [Macaca mulatta]